MTRVLIVDDSAIIRTMIKQILARSPDIEVVAEAANGRQGVDMAKTVLPDVIIMDVNMPIMDGIEATRRIMAEQPTVILIFTTEDVARVSYDALAAGAVDVMRKPDLAGIDTRFYNHFLEKISALKDARLKIPSASSYKEHSVPSSDYKILCIGASTGGPMAVQKVLKGFKGHFPLPILITQHIDESFDNHYASWLAETTGLPVHLAKEGIIPQNGHAYVAPADFHLVVVRHPGSASCILHLNKDPHVHFLRPAVDKLFQSAAEVFGSQCLAVLLTGMGKDGAAGCRAVFDAGGFTIAESGETCVVFGMPKAAIDCGGVKEVIPLPAISSFIHALIRGSR